MNVTFALRHIPEKNSNGVIKVTKEFSKVVAGFFAVFTLIFIGWILLYQDVTASDLAKYQMMSGIERLEYFSENEADREELHIALPRGLSEKEIIIKNDYLTRTVTVEIPRTSSNHLYRNPITGNSKNINRIDYVNMDKTLMVEINLDDVRECQVTYEKNLMTINFIEPRQLYDRIIVIDAGHGGEDPGTLSGDVYESHVNLAIAQYFRDYLEKAGIRVYMTKDEDIDPLLSQRVEMSNSIKPDAFISIHNNATPDGSTEGKGVHVLYHEADETNRSAELADILLDTVTKSFESVALFTEPRDDLHIVRRSIVPVCLVEVGFITNPEDCEKLGDPEWQKKAAKGLFDGIMIAYEKGLIHE